ncbi:MAG: FGGY family carbohydrate kinase [Candidatus Jordarchaeaceae archaeon]
MKHKEGFFVVIDAGTTGVRSMIFDTAGNSNSKAYEEYQLKTPGPGLAEQDPEDWWKAIVTTMKKALELAQVDPSQIIGIGITNQRATTTAVDSEGKALFPSIVWLDRRSPDILDFIRGKVGPEVVYRISGQFIDPTWSPVKILWLKQNYPEIFKKAYKFVLVHDWIYFKLTGNFITDWSNASWSIIDINKREWSKELSKDLGIPLEKLPDLYPSGKVAGHLRHEAAQEIGLLEGTPVVTGGGDQQCASIGLGVISPGSVKATTGTGTFIQACLDSPVLDPKRRLICSCHAVPGKWILEGTILSTGIVYRWFRDHFASSEVITAQSMNISPYELINSEAERAMPGCKGLIALPYFMGAGSPSWNSNAKGVLFGLSLDHSKNELARAILESNGYEIRRNIEIIEELGLQIKEIYVDGGGAQSGLWRQIQADITGKDILFTGLAESTSLGAAILAGVGTGVYKEVKDATDHMVKIKERRKPVLENQEIYNRFYPLYVELYERLKPLFDKLVALQDQTQEANLK